MKKYIKLIAAISMVALLAACSSSAEKNLNSNENTPNTNATNGAHPNMIDNQSNQNQGITEHPLYDFSFDENGELIVPVDEPIDVEFENYGVNFTLSEKEQDLYERLKETLDINILKDADPFNIAKIYIQAGIDSEWQVEWLLFAPETITVSQEYFSLASEFESKMYARNYRQGMADLYFGLIDETGAFWDFGNGSGCIVLYTVEVYLDYLEAMDNGVDEEDIDDAPIEFFLKQNENGIWQVMYNPLNSEHITTLMSQ